MLIILNEKEYAEKCLAIGIFDRNPYQVMSILSKYYYHYMNYKKKKIYDSLIEYLKKYYPRYELNEDAWRNNMDKLASHAGKSQLFIADGVSITVPEIEKIKAINNKVLGKLAFTMLCIAKLNDLKNPKNNGWVNTEAKEIFKLARVSCSVVDQNVKIGMLRQQGLLELPQKNENLNFRINFIEDGEQALFISDFRELGYEYLRYIGGNYSNCMVCGILMPQNKNRTKKYCKDCASHGHICKKKIAAKGYTCDVNSQK